MSRGTQKKSLPAVERRRRDLEERERRLRQQVSHVRQGLAHSRQPARPQPPVLKVVVEDAFTKPRVVATSSGKRRPLSAQRRRDRNVFIALAVVFLLLMFVIMKHWPGF